MGIVSGEIAAPISEEEFRLQAEEEEGSWPEGLPVAKDLSWILPDMDGGFKLYDGDSDCPYWIGYRDAARTEIGARATIHQVFISASSL